jgi:hypothetical protein
MAASSVSERCEYITPDEAKGLLGVDAHASTAPSKGLFTSCGYTNLTGDALTIYISDYGLPSVAQQFFEKTREVLKSTTNEDTLGAAAFSYTATAPVPAAPGGSSTAPSASSEAAPPASGAATQTPVATNDRTGAPVVPIEPPGVITLVVLKDHRTVKLEAAGPFAGRPQQLPKLRAIASRVVAALPPPTPETPR